jgi:hypothetical protein
MGISKEETSSRVELQGLALMILKVKSNTTVACLTKKKLLGRRLSAQLVRTFADRECHMVSVTDPYGRILGCSRP